MVGTQNGAMLLRHTLGCLLCFVSAHCFAVIRTCSATAGPVRRGGQELPGAGVRGHRVVRDQHDQSLLRRLQPPAPHGGRQSQGALSSIFAWETYASSEYCSGACDVSVPILALELCCSQTLTLNSALCYMQMSMNSSISVPNDDRKACGHRCACSAPMRLASGTPCGRARRTPSY